MRPLVERYAEVAFVLLVTGAAMSPWPWLALVTGGGFYVALTVLADRRQAVPPPAEPEAAP